MALLEHEHRMHELIAELFEESERASRHNGAVWSQSMMLIEDAARLYEENDKMRKQILSMYETLQAYAASAPMGRLLIREVEAEMRGLGIEA